MFLFSPLRMSMHNRITPITPISPATPWLGGKRALAKRLCAKIDAIPCETYAEPFVGMGGIFLRRSAKPKAEVINDKGRDVANFFRILQRHYVAFLDMLRFQITVRAEFNRLVATDPDTLTDLERAARFLYLQRLAFGGKVSGRNFGVSVGRAGRFNLTSLEPMLEDLHSRLAGVIIECLDFGDFLSRYDSAQTLFYLDPPYWGCENDYGKAMFERSDFERLSGLLKSLKGRFILSINDVPEIREIFYWAQIEEVKTTYSINANAEARGPRAELLIGPNGS
jgi:DNA adenine methylase